MPRTLAYQALAAGRSPTKYPTVLIPRNIGGPSAGVPRSIHGFELPHDADEHAEDLDILRNDRLHRAVGRRQADLAAFLPVDALERRLAAVDRRHDDLTVAGARLLANNDV